MEIYFGTILVEPNRWKGLPPATAISPWIARALEAGFDGVELWERHFLEAGPAEAEAVLARGGAVRVYNSYARFDAAGEPGRAASLAAIGRLAGSLRGVKFNLGRHGADREAEQAEAGRFRSGLPAGVGFWCECHEGTVLESPEAAGSALAGWGPGSAAIVHPVGQSPERLRAWFEATGGRVAHLHLQARGDDGRFTALRNRAASVVAAFEALRALGFAGSATLEFTTGVGGADEDPARTFDEAVADLEFLKREVGA